MERRSAEGAGAVCYVSLTGLTGTDAIGEAIVAALHPAVCASPLKYAGAIVKGATGLLGVAADGFGWADFVRATPDSLLVFDDLDRAALPGHAVLGYLNGLTEHVGCRVIVLANEAEVAPPEPYRRAKEKVIGQTLALQPDFDAAFTAFVDQVDQTDAKRLLTRHKAEFQAVYDASETRNLRLLQRVLDDCVRLVEAVPPKFRRQSGLMDDVLPATAAVGTEFRAGRVAAEDLRGLTARLVMLEDEEAGSVVRAVADRYGRARVALDGLTDGVWIDLFCHGLADPETIDAALTRMAPSGLPHALGVLRDPTGHRETDVQHAINRLEKDFAQRKSTDPGEMARMFDLRLRLARSRLLADATEQVAEQCRAYIDDLYAAGRLVPLRETAAADGVLEPAGLSATDNARHGPLLHTITDYLADRRKAAGRRPDPATMRRLLDLVKSDADGLRQRLDPLQDPTPFEAASPVLAWLDPLAFADTVCALAPAPRRTVMLTLRDRYKPDRLYTDAEMGGELDWAIAVRDRLLDHARDLSQIGRWQLETITNSTLGAVLRDDGF